MSSFKGYLLAYENYTDPTISNGYNQGLIYITLAYNDRMLPLQIVVEKQKEMPLTAGNMLFLLLLECWPQYLHFPLI